MVIKGNHTMTVTNASSHEAKTVLIQAADAIEITVGGSTITMNGSSIDISSTQVSINGSTMVTVKGGILKLN